MLFRFHPIYFHGWIVFDFLLQASATQSPLPYPAAHNLAAALNSITRKPL